MQPAEEELAFQISALINHQINGTISEVEKTQLENWLSQSDSRRQLLASLTDSNQRESFFQQFSQYNTEEALERLNGRIATTGQEAPQKTFTIKKVLLIAAVLTGVFILTFAYRYRAEINNWLFPMQYRELVVKLGERKTIQLSDGTKVWLNAGTTIKYPEAFTADTRKVILQQGEAFFEVAHDPRKAFIIQANGANVQVLGTTFEVSSFANEPEMKVTVRTGKVGVIQTAVHEPTAFLLPGDRAVINKLHHTLQKLHVDTADIAAWRTDRLVFENEPLAEVFASLERKYNVHIQIKNDHLLTEKVTTRLDNQPLINVLTALSFSNHFTFQKISDRSVIVK